MYMRVSVKHHPHFPFNALIFIRAIEVSIIHMAKGFLQNDIAIEWLVTRGLGGSMLLYNLWNHTEKNVLENKPISDLKAQLLLPTY